MSNYSDLILADSPTGYWRLNESSGTSLADGSGNAKTMTLSGSYALSQSGVVIAETDGAIKFTGGYATKSAAVLTAVDNVSIECWIKTTDSTTATGNRSVVYIGNPGSSGYGIYLFSGVVWFLAGGVASKNMGFTPSVGVWAHLVLVRNSGTWSLYVNGVSTGVTSTATPNTPSANTGFAVNSSGSETLNGTLDEVAVYATALSSGQILKHYQMGLAVASFTGFNFGLI